MATKKRIAVIEAGSPDADGLAGLFILFGYGGLSVSSYLHRHGYEVKYFPMFASTKLDETYLDTCDYLLISTMTHTAKIGYDIADRVRARRKTPPVVVFGGPHPTVLPEDTLEHCDYVVMNEGEETVLELLQHLDGNGKANGSANGSVAHIQGLAYKNGEASASLTPSRTHMQEIDIPLEPDLIHHYPGILGNFLKTKQLRFPFPVVQFSRGCPFACSFCLGMRQLGKSYRTRPSESVVEDLRRFHKLTRFPYGMFHDNEFTIRRKETKELLRAMIRSKTKIRRMSAFARVESSKDEELWRLFDEAGIANVFFGVESLNQDTLNDFNKGTAVPRIYDAMERIRSYGVKTRIVTSFIIADVEDPLKELRMIREFWREYHHQIQRVVIQPLMEYPFQEKNGRIKQLYPDEQFIHYDWNYYAGDYLIFYPTNVPPSVLQQAFLDTFREIHTVPGCPSCNLDYRIAQGVIRYSHREKERRLERYIERLKVLEKGKYDRPWTVVL